MHTFIPFGTGKETIGRWMGGINITPALTFDEARYLSQYLMTWHFAYPSRDLDGLYCIHQDREKEEQSKVPGQQYSILKEKQEAVPSLIAPLILGSNDWSKKTQINTIGVKTHIKGVKHAASWILFMIEHFFKKDAYAKHLFVDTFGEFKDHVCNGKLIYLDDSKNDACTAIVVENNNVSSFGVLKTYYTKINDGFRELEYPFLAKTKSDMSAEYRLKKEGLSMPSSKIMEEQDKKIKMKDLWLNLDKATYQVMKPEIFIPERLKIEYEEYYMENNIPEAQSTQIAMAKF